MLIVYPHLHIFVHISSKVQSSKWVSAQPPFPSAGMLALKAFRNLRWMKIGESLHMNRFQ